MIEIKFKYIFKHKNGEIKEFFVDMEEIEFNGGYSNNYILNDDGCWDLVHRLQYTGLKDKNGVEVYEGDVVEHLGIGVGFVEYREKHAAYKIVFEGTTRKWFVDMLDREYDLISVIGNIYQNPELLKSE